MYIIDYGVCFVKVKSSCIWLVGGMGTENESGFELFCDKLKLLLDAFFAQTHLPQRVAVFAFIGFGFLRFSP